MIINYKTTLAGIIAGAMLLACVGSFDESRGALHAGPPKATPTVRNDARCSQLSDAQATYQFVAIVGGALTTGSGGVTVLLRDNQTGVLVMAIVDLVLGSATAGAAWYADNRGQLYVSEGCAQ